LRVLVDTSVWIRFLSGRNPHGTRLDALLHQDAVVGHELIYGELLVGDRGGRKRLLADYALMNQAKLVPHREVVAFVERRKLHGRGAGWIDVHLLAAALVENIPLWTADPRLNALAGELDISFPS
jgi:predicted nucleic acid-binding protein